MKIGIVMYLVDERTKVMNENLKELQRVIGYRFNNENLLFMALTHSSYANDKKLNMLNCNERLEFLGDAVLEICSSEYLYDTYKEKPEGELTKLRASLVSEKPLAAVAFKLGIDQFIYLGRGEEQTGGRKRESITSDAVEAIIGAMYLDGGMEPARVFVRKYIMTDVDEKKLFHDSKTVLQEIVQKYKLGDLEYVIVNESGPDHDKSYEAECRINGKNEGSGKGHTKKAAQQQAAYNAIKKLNKNY